MGLFTKKKKKKVVLPEIEFQEEAKKVPEGIEYVEVGGMNYYRVVGRYSLHRELWCAKKQLEGMKNAN